MDKKTESEAAENYLAAHQGELKFMLALNKENKLDILYDEKTIEKIIGATAFVRQIFVEQFNNEVHLREKFVKKHNVKVSQKSLRNAKGKLSYTALKKTGICIEMMSQILDALSEQYKQHLIVQAKKSEEEPAEEQGPTQTE
ncbi:MAG: hypothetical protein ACO1HP_02570 [Bacteroidota bacterium]|jgi:uncharacterized protein YsxB (DUF464 family)